MRKLTRREIILLTIVAFVVLVLLIEPIIRQGFPGDELTRKQEQLQTAQNLVELAQITQRVNREIQTQVGLEGQIISDSLFEEITDRVDLESLNEARRASALAVLHPALGNKVDSLLAYKQQHGEFGSLDELKKIRGPIFEGEQPQAVISRRISALAQRAGLRPNYQLNIRAMSGTKSENFSLQTKKNLVSHLYLDELANELQRLQSEQKAVEAAEGQQQIEPEETAMEAMFDAWWGEDNAEEKSKEDTVETTSEKPPVKEVDAETESIPTKDIPLPPKAPRLEANRQFVSLPEVIPLILRIELSQFIQSNLKRQLAEAVESRRGFLAGQIAVSTDEAKGGFFGIGSQQRTTAIKFKPNSILLSKFDTLINRYKTDGVEESAKRLDYDQQLRALTEYIDQILEQENRLHDWFATVPSTHQPEAYIVDMRFSNNLERLVRLIYAIESSSKWLQIRDLQITIADKKQTTISANLSMIARIL